MKVFAVTSIKGGVGKTASAVHLAFHSAAGGARTLLWDLDPQAAATYQLRTEPKVEKTGRALARGEARLDQLARATDYELLEVLPADLSLRRLEGALAERGHPESWMRELLAEVEARYQHVVLDCPPGLTLLAENVYEAADAILTPTIPTPLSLRALAQMVKFLHGREERRYRVLPYFCMVDRRRSLHRETCEWVHAQRMHFLRTELPYSSLIEQAAARREPVGAFAPGSEAAASFERLWAEVLERLGAKRTELSELPHSPNRIAREQVEHWQAARGGAPS